MGKNIDALVENDVSRCRDVGYRPIHLEGGSHSEVFMKLPDIVSSTDVWQGDVVVEDIVRQHSEGVFHAISSPVDEEGSGDIDRFVDMVVLQKGFKRT